MCRRYDTADVQQDFRRLDIPPHSPCLFNQTGREKERKRRIRRFSTLVFDLCKDGRSMKWKYNGVNDSIQSSLLILGGSFLSNQTYQWMVIMENKRNQFLQSTGYVLVRVEETFPPMIAIG